MRSTTFFALLALCFCIAQQSAAFSLTKRHEAVTASDLQKRVQEPPNSALKSAISRFLGGGDSSATTPATTQSRVTTKKAPAGAYGTVYNLSKGTIFAWISKTPHDQTQASAVYITLHGVDRNADAYFKFLNDAYRTARSKGKQYADYNVIRISPLLPLTNADAKSLNASSLAWGPDNDWATGNGSTHPDGSNFSSLEVFDELIDYYSDKSKFPNVKLIALVGHGGGALLFQRYAALRQANDAVAPVSLRYVIGNPSSMTYFTTDRPGTVDSNACNYYNDYYYGLDNYYIPYSANTGDAGSLFKAYAARDVRYLVSLGDTSATNGDQSCGARAQGGSARKDRSLSYWKYINLLAKGAGRQNYDSLSGYPGQFQSLQDGSSQRTQFLTPNFKHQIKQIKGTGHDAGAVLSSTAGQNAIFGP